MRKTSESKSKSNPTYLKVPSVQSYGYRDYRTYASTMSVEYVASPYSQDPTSLPSLTQAAITLLKKGSLSVEGECI